MVIGAPHINDALKTTFELVHVIGNISGEIRFLAIVTHDYAVFFVAIISGTKPQCAVLLIHMSTGFEAIYGAIYRTAFIQRTLRIPHFVINTEVVQIVTNIVKDVIQPQIKHLTIGGGAQQVFGACNQCVDVIFFVTTRRLIKRQVLHHYSTWMAQAVTVLLMQFCGDVTYVLAFVTVGRKH